MPATEITPGARVRVRWGGVWEKATVQYLGQRGWLFCAHGGKLRMFRPEDVQAERWMINLPCNCTHEANAEDELPSFPCPEHPRGPFYRHYLTIFKMVGGEWRYMASPNVMPVESINWRLTLVTGPAGERSEQG